MNKIIKGDVLDVLKTLESDSNVFDTSNTSPFNISFIYTLSIKNLKNGLVKFDS